MATFSLFENIVIKTPEEAEAFVQAIELSEALQKKDKKPQQKTDFRLATREDIIRMAEMRKQKNGQLNEPSR